MKERIFIYASIILLVGGFFSYLYLQYEIISVKIKGVFWTVVTDNPNRGFGRFSCPNLLGINETSQVSVTINNPTYRRLVYSVVIISDGVTILSPAPHQTIGITSMNTLTWTVAASRSGEQVVEIRAVSDYDEALPGIFHSWDTSYAQACGIFVLPVPLSGKLVMILVKSSILIGYLMPVFWLIITSWKSNTRKHAREV
jgi:hypothetical protein